MESGNKKSRFIGGSYDAILNKTIYVNKASKVCFDFINALIAPQSSIKYCFDFFR
jgi:hypothetical protein